MSNKKDLSVEVKTVLHGEVLGPDDEGYEPRKNPKEEKVNSFKESIERNHQAYQQMNRMGNYMSQEFGGYLGSLFGNHHYGHKSGPLGPCQICGRY